MAALAGLAVRAGLGIKGLAQQTPPPTVEKQPPPLPSIPSEKDPNKV